MWDGKRSHSRTSWQLFPNASADDGWVSKRRSYVQAIFAHCQDGLCHFALSIRASIAASGPITTRTEGYTTEAKAEEAALRAAVRSHEPDSIRGKFKTL
jgi:hypothetical protein